MVLANLFLAFLRVGLFAVGGAYSFLPLIEKEVVERYQWLSKKEFLDVLGITQIFPGAISIKYATYTGYKMAGILGALVANLGNIFAPVLFIIFGSLLYIKYKDYLPFKNALSMIQLVIFAMLVALAFQTVNLSQLSQIRNLAIIILAFILFLYTKIHPALIITTAGILGVLLR